MRTHTISRRVVVALAGGLLLSAAACFTIEDPDQNLALFSIITGNNQTIPVSTTAPDPLVVQTLDGQIAPMPGNTVSWIVSSGGGTLSSASTVTDEGGTTEVEFTASSTPGPVTVRASTKDISVTFAINVVAAQ